MRYLHLGLALTLCSTVACMERSFQESAEVNEIQSSNLFGKQLGIGDKKIALTFDDGPGERTVELAQFLADSDAPATFFVQGSRAASEAGRSRLQQIAAMKLKTSGKRAHLLANHTFNHVQVNNAGNDASGEVMRTHNTIKELMSGLPLFFRAPYGMTMESGERGQINADASLRSYVGPIYWDLGGSYTREHSADWACWSGYDGIPARSVQACADGYVREAILKKGGIFLAHDIHSKTIDMMKLLVPKLKAEGFTFVGLDHNPEKVAAYGGRVEASLPPATINAATKSEDPSGRALRFTVACAGCAKVELWVDGLAQVLHTETASPASFTYDRQFSNPGKRIMTAKGFDGSGKQVREGAVTFIVGQASTSEKQCTTAGGDGFANVRDAANGNVLGKLPNGKVVFAVGALQNGWYNVRLTESVGGTMMGWIHNSVVACP